jgi:hypothetical protein
MLWIDQKNYRNNKVEGAESTCGVFKIMIHHWIGCDDIWFLSINGIFDRKELDVKTLKDAKQEAGKLFNKCIGDALIDLEM